jgi:acyl-CoA thioesterase-1
VAAGVAEQADPLRLVTLGDAYTKGWGTAAPQRDGWPGQLQRAMRDGAPRLRLIKNLADSGETSADVRGGQLPQVESLEPDVVTMQVGVNDIIDPYISLDDYRTNVSAILDELLLILPAERIFVITTPDHTLTERGLDWTESREEGSAAVAEVNGILEEIATERNIEVVDISRVYDLVPADPSLVIGKWPYPTAKQYAGWVEIIGQHLHRVLAPPGP